MAAKTLTAHEWPLNKVFSSAFEFEIPDYQRSSRWGSSDGNQWPHDFTDEQRNRWAHRLDIAKGWELS